MATFLLVLHEVEFVQGIARSVDDDLAASSAGQRSDSRGGKSVTHHFY